MQIKKDDVKNRILGAATQEFLDMGFEKSSLRRIVKAAGTTTGNFYNYFENKESLFDTLVGEVYQLFIYVIENHNKWEQNNALWESGDINQWRVALLDIVTPLMPKLDDAFLLLIDCSKGTKYEHARQRFIEVLNEHFMEHIDELCPNYPLRSMGPILAEQLINGMILSLRRTKDVTLRSHLIIEQFLFFVIGVMGLLQGGTAHDSSND